MQIAQLAFSPTFSPYRNDLGWRLIVYGKNDSILSKNARVEGPVGLNANSAIGI